jgi:hypothetical protein
VLAGTTSGPEDDGVVHLLTTNALGYLHRCTGTLIANNLVATAQHCVSNFDDRAFDCTPEGELDSGSDGGQMGTLLVPADIEIRVGSDADVNNRPPVALGSRIFAPRTATICKNDIAFVVLDRGIEGVAPYPIRLTSSVQPGDTLRVAGYGATESVIDVRHVRDGLRVSLVGDNEFRPDGESLAPRSFLTVGPALCPGDSGGPAFAESGALVGVFSLVMGGNCDSPRVRNVFTQVSPFHQAVIGPAFEEAGATPIVEPSEGSGGSGGSMNTSGGEGGEGGVPGAGGTAGTGGGTSAGGNAGSATAGTGAVGDAGTAGDEPVRRGLRQEGGCRCDVPGGKSHPGGHAGAAVVLFALASAVRRKRRRAA